MQSNFDHYHSIYPFFVVVVVFFIAFFLSKTQPKQIVIAFAMGSSLFTVLGFA